jgi:polysaccharide export outer membrane protein
MTASCRSKNIAEMQTWVVACVLGCAVLAPNATLLAQAPAAPAPQTQKPAPPVPQPQKPATPGQPPASVTNPPAVAHPTDVYVPGNYVIGPDDVLGVVFWKDKEMSADVRVRPDGRIALPLINEVQAAGLTPEDLQNKLTEESKKFMEDASITVVIREINSLKVFITGEVTKPGVYPLTASMSVMQLLSVAGGLKEYANAKNITIMRNQGGKQTSLKFNYKEVAAGKNLKQNIELKPGDTVVVP